MKTTKRFAIVIGFLIALLAALAYVGVNYAAKPVSWMPTAFIILSIVLAIGIIWSFNPYFMKIKSIGYRYTAEGIAVIITLLITAYVGYVIFGNLWLLFGGGL